MISLLKALKTLIAHDLHALARNPVREAEARWTRNNQQARAAGCPCGAPATNVTYHPDVIGTVPAETWTCNQHAGASSFAWRRLPDGTITDFQAHYQHNQPCPHGDHRGQGGPIGKPPTRFYCPHPTHDRP